MEADDITLGDERSNIAASVADEARFKRRRAAFRRRASGALIGVVLVVGLVFWQRNVGILNRCRDSLRTYGDAAIQNRLESEHNELLQSSWEAISVEAPMPATHYEVLGDNWLSKPSGDKEIVLALCKHPHGSLTGSGRWALIRTAKGLTIRWMDETAAEKLAPAVEPSE